MNGDGKPDLIVASPCDSNFSCAGVVGVLLATAMALQTAVGYGSGGNRLFVAVGDVNGDGKPDLLW